MGCVEGCFRGVIDKGALNRMGVIDICLGYGLVSIGDVLIKKKKRVQCVILRDGMRLIFSMGCVI